MRHLVRSLALSMGVGILCAGSPAGAVTQTAAVTGTVVKPLELIRIQDLDLGSFSLTPGSWSATVGISQAGVLSCANPNLLCTGAVQAARYQVSGTNKMTVLIHAPNVTLVNQS